jgi:hypothetical protein
MDRRATAARLPPAAATGPVRFARRTKNSARLTLTVVMKRPAEAASAARSGDARRTVTVVAHGCAAVSVGAALQPASPRPSSPTAAADGRGRSTMRTGPTCTRSACRQTRAFAALSPPLCTLWCHARRSGTEDAYFGFTAAARPMTYSSGSVSPGGEGGVRSTSVDGHISQVNSSCALGEYTAFSALP